MNLIPGKIKRLFWDVKKDGVDIDFHRSYIIRRIMDFGNMDDVKWMLETYSQDQIVEVVREEQRTLAKERTVLVCLL